MQFRGESWSRGEVEAIVADYFSMLDVELRGEALNKTEHRRSLMRVIPHRSAGSIERKHQNISAILIELGFPYIAGYKPLSNYQQLLHDLVAERLAGARALAGLVASQVDSPAAPPRIGDILASLVPPPKTRDIPSNRAGERRERYRGHGGTGSTDYLEREARNRSLGGAGEEFVVCFERARLIRQGKDRLAERVERVSVTRGDMLGYDVLSFDASGRDRMIEVKTTAYPIQTPFYVTRNELAVSRQNADRYSLYRVFGFRATPKLFTLRGALDAVCALRPVSYLGSAR